MAKTYRQCPACGKRALSIATRCPACGQEFASRPVRWEPARPAGRRRPAVAVAVLLLAGAGVVTTAIVRRSAARGREATETAAGRYAAPSAPDSARAGPSPVPADSAPSAEAVPRRARTWTRVHDRRSARADVVAVLLPGDTVLADSLQGGWWRVALEGRVVGYVYAGTLTP